MYISFILIGYFTSYYFLKILIPFLKKNLLDFPNKRSLHKFPIPRGGGIIFPIQSIFIILLSGDIVPLICLPLAIVGFIDDKFNLSSVFRFSVQFITSLLIIFFSPLLLNNLQDFGLLNLLILPFLILTFTAFINFTNFMDGIDGLVGSCFLIGFLFIGLANNPILFIFVGTIAGFLKWNWNPANIFMGDVGSTFLAAYFLTNLFRLNSLEDIIAIFLVLSPLSMDALFCVIRRYNCGHNIFTPHKLHLYQRLCQAGLSHSKVTLIYFFSCLTIGLLYNLFGIYSLILVMIILLLMGLWLEKNIATNFKI